MILKLSTITPVALIITPHACARGKVICCIIIIIIVVVVNTKIAKCGDLGTRVSCKCNESVELGECWLQYA